MGILRFFKINIQYRGRDSAIVVSKGVVDFGTHKGKKYYVLEYNSNLDLYLDTNHTIRFEGKINLGDKVSLSVCKDEDSKLEYIKVQKENMGEEVK